MGKRTRIVTSMAAKADEDKCEGNRKNNAENVESRRQRLLLLGEVTVSLSRAKISIIYHNTSRHSPLITRCCQHKNPYAASLWQHISIFCFVLSKCHNEGRHGHQEIQCRKSCSFFVADSKSDIVFQLTELVCSSLLVQP